MMLCDSGLACVLYVLECHCLGLAGSIDALATTSVDDEDVPRELDAMREKTKDERLGIVFKTVNKVRLAAKLTSWAQSALHNTTSTTTFVSRGL
jgi:hypothetical protein